jgi:hypothetical protein
MELTKRQDCPSYTSFYVCQKNGFRGCCSVDPCGMENCPGSISSIKTTVTLLSTTSSMSPRTTAIRSTSTFRNQDAVTTSLEIIPTDLATPSLHGSQSQTTSALSIGAIVGICGATAAVLIAAIIIAWLRIRKIRSSKRQIVDDILSDSLKSLNMVTNSSRPSAFEMNVPSMEPDFSSMPIELSIRHSQLFELDVNSSRNTSRATAVELEAWGNFHGGYVSSIDGAKCN